jgi:ADP-heptose:LPS heptosyltransferase
VGKPAYIMCSTPELFDSHPRVIGIDIHSDPPANVRFVDISEAIESTTVVERWLRKPKTFALPGKFQRMFERMFEAAGVSFDHVRAPQLYLTEEEKAKARELRKLFLGPCVAVVLESKHGIKTWPYMRQLLRLLKRSAVNVFAAKESFDDGDERLLRLGLHFLIGRPMRELMTYFSFMDLVIGPDTGPMHIAAALNVPTIVITREYLADLYEHYRDCQTITTQFVSKRALYTILPRRVFRAALEVVDSGHPKAERMAAYHFPRKMVCGGQGSIALFRLDGLGGTLTLSNQAKKIHDMTGFRSVVVVRGHAAAFDGNPHIEDVITVGYTRWGDSLAATLARFPTVAEIRFALGKWHQQAGEIFSGDLADLEGVFTEFPRELRKLESEGLHHVLLTDRTLGLPYDSLESKVYAFKKVPDLPEAYVVFSDGVDVQHTGLRQTKVWRGWSDLIAAVDMPFVQVGTEYDPPTKGAIDLRSRTTLPELFYLLANAAAVVCCEGGVMHAAYAAACLKPVVVLRGPTRGKLFEYPGHRFVDSYVCDICWTSTDDWFAQCPKSVDAVCMSSITTQRVAWNLERLHGYPTCSWSSVWASLNAAFARPRADVCGFLSEPDDPESFVELWWGDPQFWEWSSLPVKSRIALALSEARSILSFGRDRVIANLNKADLLICPSRSATIAFLEAHIDTRIVVVPFGVDPDRFEYVERDWADGPIKFLHAGAIQFRKGSWLIPEAFVSAFSKADDVELTMATLKVSPMFMRLKAEYGRHPQIRFVVDHKDDPGDIYRDYHVYVSPHLAEGFGLMPLEAMATGMVTLVSRCSAPREYFHSDYGFWIDMSESYAPVAECLIDTAGFWRLPDVNSLAACMKEAYLMRRQAMEKGCKASAFARECMTWIHTVSNIKQKIQEVLDEKALSNIARLQ